MAATNGTNDVNTDTALSAKTFPNNRKLNDKGFVKSSNVNFGKEVGLGLQYNV
jgi:flagellar basal body rod protein FlgC